jgi:predicted Zn-dependent protease
MYSFANKDELVAVLAHEFGHALGLDHVEGRSSIMYYLLETTSSFPTLTENDTAAFQELCGDGTEFSNRFRQFIRIAATTLTT